MHQASAHSESQIHNEAIDADADQNDADSAYGQSLLSDSTSLCSSVLSYKYENGRRYHAFKEGSYSLPNDEDEQDRLDLLHHVCKLTLDGAGYLAPIKDPKRVLDLGTGTGIWAIEFADDNPQAVVHGVDLSPIQPGFIPTNLAFLVDDIEADWDYKGHEKFDFIHARSLAASISDWPKLLKACYDNLEPGGYLELQDGDATFTSDDDTIKQAQGLTYWTDLLSDTFDKIGKPLRVARSFKAMMEEAGFEDVKEHVYKVPCGTWPLDKKLKHLGVFAAAAYLGAIEPYSLAVFTRTLNYSHEQILDISESARRDLRRKDLHIYLSLIFVYGRKPGGA